MSTQTRPDGGTDPENEPETTSATADYYPELYRQLEYAIAPEHLDERGHAARWALDDVRTYLTDHPHYDEIVKTLEAAIEGVEECDDPEDVENYLRGAYSLLPYRFEVPERPVTDGGRVVADGGEDDERRGYNRAHGPDGLPGYLYAAVVADVSIERVVWEVITEHAAEQVVRGKNPEDAYWDSVYEYVEVTPNLVVDGETKGYEEFLAELDE